MRLIKLLFAVGVLLNFSISVADETGDAQRWSIDKANGWYKDQPWYTGFNYAPRYAINQLEMWQEDTFDPEILDQELGWAEDIGFNMARVFLHNLLWDQDQEAFTRRIEQFLEIADKHNVKIMFVLFDDVWDPAPKLGKQRSPIPHTHNSGWVQAPGKAILEDVNRHDELEGYVRGIIRRYGNDPRVAIWDLYNEPGGLNSDTYGTREVANKEFHSLQLLKKVFNWAREEKPSQPLTSGVWRASVAEWNGVWRDSDGEWVGEDPKNPASGLYHFMLDNSDIITFHSYVGVEPTKKLVNSLKRQDRPIICTEYMARPYSTFEEIMPYFAEEKIGAINWGFVEGKIQTQYPWGSWSKAFDKEPTPWFHDILRGDGTAYSEEEVKFISDLINQTR